MGKSFKNWFVEKGREIIEWHWYKMRRSLQLTEAKGCIMDLAPLLKHGRDHDRAMDGDDVDGGGSESIKVE